MNIPVFKLLDYLCRTEELRQYCHVPEGMRWVIQYGDAPPAEVLAVVDGFVFHKRDGKIAKMEVGEFISRWNQIERI